MLFIDIILDDIILDGVSSKTVSEISQKFANKG